jgi:hypothetical protein
MKRAFDAPTRRCFLAGSASLAAQEMLQRVLGLLTPDVLSKTAEVDTLLASAKSDIGSGSLDALHQLFADPPKIYRPWGRWWWPGTGVETVELRKEIALFDAARFGGLEIQPVTSALPPADAATNALRNQFPSTTYFSHVRDAVEEAARHGMRMDLTFGNGWPFGGPGVTPEHALLDLATAHWSIQGPTIYRGSAAPPSSMVTSTYPTPPWSTTPPPHDLADRMKAREKTIAVIAYRGSETRFRPLKPNSNPRVPVETPGFLDGSSVIDLTDRVKPDGSLEWFVPEGTWQVFYFRQVLAAQRHGKDFVLDHFEKAAFNSYADWIGAPFEQLLGHEFGKTMRAIFCDSLEVMPNYYWADGFLDTFRQKRGYDLKPFLPFIRRLGAGKPYGGFHDLPLFELAEGNADGIRYDYWLTVSELFVEQFLEPFTDWAHRHQLVTRLQAHGGPEDLIDGYATSDIPESENQFDNGRMDFLKMASSTAHLFGKKIVGNESFVWVNHAFETTPEKMKLFADQLMIAGVNQIMYHGLPYDLPSDTTPIGWYPFRIGFSDPWKPNAPFWPYLAQLNQYFSRLQMILRESEVVSKVLVYKQGNNGGVAYEEILPSEPEPAVNDALTRGGYAFDHINDTVISRLRINGRTALAPSGIAYEALIFDNAERMPLATMEHAATLARAGFPLVFIGRHPRHESGYRENAAKSSRIASLASELKIMPMVRSIEEAHAVTSVLADVAVTPNVRFDKRSTPFLHKRLGGIDVFFFTNPSEDAIDLSFRVSKQGGAERLDAWSGKSYPVRYRSNADGTDLHLRLAPYGSTLILVGASITLPSLEAPPVSMPARLIDLNRERWSLHLVSTVGPPRELNLPLVGPTDWSELAGGGNLTGRGSYSTRFDVAADITAAKSVVLALGDVRDVAEITLNGHVFTPVLCRPYEVDVTGILRTGSNDLTILVQNALYNAGFAETKVLQGTTITYLKRSPLPAGLLGPVALVIRSSTNSEVR